MRRAAVWAAAALLLAAVTAAGRATGLNAATIGFAYLVAVLFLSVWGGLLGALFLVFLRWRRSIRNLRSGRSPCATRRLRRSRRCWLRWPPRRRWCW